MTHLHRQSEQRSIGVTRRQSRTRALSPDCGHKHRTPEAAARCDETRVQRPARRANPGSRAWIDTRILATEADGAERRMSRRRRAYDAIIAADNA